MIFANFIYCISAFLTFELQICTCTYKLNLLTWAIFVHFIVFPPRSVHLPSYFLGEWCHPFIYPKWNLRILLSFSLSLYIRQQGFFTFTFILLLEVTFFCASGQALMLFHLYYCNYYFNTSFPLFSPEWLVISRLKIII